MQVKDVSSQGLALVSSRRFEQGSVLVVELGDSAVQPVTVIARVVRLQHLSNGTWLIGCSFFNDLINEDFESFRTKNARTPTNDRRGSVRLPSNRMASCRKHSPGSLGQWLVEIKDQSSDGVGLLCNFEVEEGIRLRLDLPAYGDNVARTVIVRVVRKSRHPDGRWFLGCSIS